MFLDKTRPVWAEISLDNLSHNMQEIKRVVDPNTEIMSVIKADGYGHGACQIADTLLDNGVSRFAVATLSEAIQLRKKYQKVPILILGYTPEASSEDIIKNEITQAIYSLEQANSFSKMAQKLGKPVIIHIKIDTGMGRLGFQPTEESVETIKHVFELPNIEVEGIFTHFAVADEQDKNFTKEQFEKFTYVCRKLEDLGVQIPIKHVSNSAATIDLPDFNLNLIRAGIIQYGLYPSEDVDKTKVNLKRVLSLKCKVSHIKDLPKGVGISYGLKYVTKKPSKIATLPIGYADGFTRMLTGKAEALIKGKRVPVVGRICMDQCMIDVSGIDVNRGDEVVLIGNDGDEEISVEEIAMKLGTINYEIVCMISKRVPRVYIKNNRIVSIVDHLLDN